MKEQIKENIKANLDYAFKIAKYLYENPELGYEEKKACKALSDAFENFDFKVERGIYDIPTAFKASYGEGEPRIIICAEYDALPQIGHGCGHNLIASMALLSAASLAPVLSQTGGKVTVFGTPAEEVSGAKVSMAEKGAFDDASVAMMAHPSPVSEESGTSLTLIPLQFQYYGKSAHAAACPEEGINALDAVVHLYNGINALRQHVPNDVQFHGYISNGGCAPNIVPDFAEARFYIRANKKTVAEAAAEKVRKVAEGAALMTGARVEISSYEATYYDLVTNKELLSVFTANQESLGDKVMPAKAGIGSLDLGNVSYRTPCVHGWIGFNDPSLVIHSSEFADKTVTAEGRDLLYRGACTLALTGYDVITDKELLSRIRKEFELSL